MRVCISYTYPYSIKSLNHTLSFRKCKLYFGANMQVVSTLWPDIKSQKISKRWFKLKRTNVAQEPIQMKSRQANPNVDQTKRPRTACQKKLGAVGGPGRPTDLPGRPTWPVGPNASTRARGASPLVPYIDCEGSHPWLPAINTRGVEYEDTHTHHTSSPLMLILHSL